MTTGPFSASVEASAYVSQLYLNGLGRTASAFEVDTIGAWFDRSEAEGNKFLNILFDSYEYRARVINEAYDESFGRAPTSSELASGVAAFGSTGSSRDALLSIYGSSTYYAEAGGGTNVGFVRALYTDVLGRGAEPSGEAHWLNQLATGSSRSAVARGILNSPESNRVTVNELYGQYLYRTAEPGGLNHWSTLIAQGRRPEFVARSIVAAPEYVNAALTTTGTVTETAAGNPNFSTLVTALQATGLDSVLDGKGPYTVFAPTNAAFANLPPGVLAGLLANPQLLTQVLLYHVSPGVISGPEVASAGLLDTAQGQMLGVSGGQNGQPLTVGGANVVASVRTTNGIIHVIDTVLSLPTQTITEIAAGNPNFSTLVTALQATGLDTVLAGTGPFTVFAPTNDAFAKLPPGTLAALLADPAQLTQILLYHVVPGEFSSNQLAREGRATTVQGAPVIVGRAGAQVVINGANVIASNIVATNGVIQVIDTVLIPPG